jgi:nitrile hydratase beta subunit
VNGVHDMGGMHGFGPVIDEPEGTPFHEAWEGRIHALTLASPTRDNIDAGRHQRELIPPAEYLAMTYYAKWLRSLSERLVASGLATADELADGRAAPGSPQAEPRFRAAEVEFVLTRPASYVREAAAPPLFAPGARVRCKQLNPTGHTRLPRYARGHVGEVVRWHGAHVFPDANAHGRGEDPQHLYTVRFGAQELWGEAANPRDSVSLNLWEPYLERA